MKKYICGLILASSFLQAVDPKLWTAVDVRQLYQDAQQGNTQHIDNNLSWHRERDTKAPVEMLEKARDMAAEKNDTYAALVLNARLKKEQMGFWERNFRGITLGAIIAAIVGAGIALKSLPVSHDDSSAGNGNAQPASLQANEARHRTLEEAASKEIEETEEERERREQVDGIDPDKVAEMAENVLKYPWEEKS
ncbi:MAG: hypothetical protein ACHQVS_04940 [Candidatus Babeliales bacterium]